MLEVAAASRGLRFRTRTTSACESHKECRSFVRNRFFGGADCNCHFFKDVMSLLPRDVLDTCRERLKTHDRPFEFLYQEIMGCKLKEFAPCELHPTQLCAIPSVDVDISGTKCQEHSRSNAVKQGLNSEDAILFLTWAKFHLERETAVVVHENVVGFPSTIFGRIFSRDSGITIYNI